jgi:hypothetical protein
VRGSRRGFKKIAARFSFGAAAVLCSSADRADHENHKNLFAARVHAGPVEATAVCGCELKSLTR